MKRRDFLKYSGLVTAGTTLSLNPVMQLFAAPDNYQGPLWLTIDARGGWDPTTFCDPKGHAVGQEADPARLNNYLISEIDQPRDLNGDTVGSPIRVAPLPRSFRVNEVNNDPNLYSAKQFFDKYYSRLLIINGIDNKTNSHSDGVKHTWSGELSRNGYPNFGALLASIHTPNRPMAFITNGGYSVAANLTVPIRMDYRGRAALFEIANPNRTSPTSPTSRLYFPEDVGANVVNLIKTASAERQLRILEKQNLLRIRRSLELLTASRANKDSLKDLADLLSSDVPPERTITSFNDRRNALNLYQQGRLALAAFETQTTSAAHLSIGGFDTHDDHDTRHYPVLMDFLMGIDAILDEAQSRGLSDKIVLVIGSDFGRTNKYNVDNGKDHWPITSMMFMGNSQQIIVGNRVIGQTTSDHQAMNVMNNSSFDPVDPSTPGSVRLTPGHVHRALRRLAGIDTLVSDAFGLGNEDLNVDIFQG